MLNIAVIGVGLVGAELVTQIRASSASFSLFSLSSSTRTLFHPGADWKSALAASPHKTDLTDLTKKLRELVDDHQRVAVVDNTSSDEVAALYPEWLRHGFHVVTCSKKAFSGELALWEDILEASSESGARFLNEATVGAGLPVINTLKELVASGDKITKIEGVFSGTMSYIFNEFSTGYPDGPAFSSVVATARKKGYTEPHPADDLNGFDVARKLTILSRTISAFSSTATSHLLVLQSFKSVQTTSLIPPALEGSPTGDDFISCLPEFDEQFAQLRTEASAQGKVLRFVGIIDVQTGQAKAGLEKYPITHPFATSLGGSDNIMLFHTERYSPRPLIIQGAGAGAAVTAMGVLVCVGSTTASMSAAATSPAPWKLKGRTWVFVLSGLSNNASFPAGFAVPYQAQVLSEGGKFLGGPSFVQVVSYSESPVGPYDELMYCPGRWSYGRNGSAFRVTRIYVSSKSSVENGRRNWNIPKQLANFSIRPGPNSSTIFTVSLPSAPDQPFFNAQVQPISLLSSLSIPFSASILGKYYALMQPPLPENPSSEQPEEVGTNKWANLIPVLKGNIKVVKLVAGSEEGAIGDGVHFPKVKPWSVATEMNDLSLDFGVPTLFDEV